MTRGGEPVSEKVKVMSEKTKRLCSSFLGVREGGSDMLATVGCFLLGLTKSVMRHDRLSSPE